MEENIQNAELITSFMLSRFAIPSDVQVLDCACGVYDSSGSNYDEGGLVYQPVVSQKLGKIGFKVTGVDLRKSYSKEPIHYLHVTNIDLLKPDWTSNFEAIFETIVFLRSWDTPEIVLFFQNKFKEDNLNKLSIFIADYFLNDFQKLLSIGGYLITSELFNFGICESFKEIMLYQDLTKELFFKYGFKILEQKEGLYFLVKIA